MKYFAIFLSLHVLWGITLIWLIEGETLLVHVTRIIPWILLLRIVRYFLFRRVPIDDRFGKDHTILVTGASCGIGAQIASDLTGRGGKVIWTGRDVAKAQKVLDDIEWTYYHGTRGYVLYLDLASKHAIRKCVEEFKKHDKKLHCIIFNAAYNGNRRLTADGFEQTIGVNHLGHMYLLYLLLDQIASSAPARIVVVTSDLHKVVKSVRFDDLMYEKDYGAFAAYNHSKLLNILFVRELARRLKGSRINVYSAHPGTPIRSELLRDTLLRWTLFDQLILRPLCWNFCRSPYDGAQTPIYCAASPKCENDSGEYYENCRLSTPSALAMDDSAAAKLWEMSCNLLGIPQDFVEKALKQAADEKDDKGKIKFQ